MKTVLQALYFMLPAYIANMAPVIFQWIPMGRGPIDSGKTWRGKRIFGDHKTWRGIVVGILLAITTIFLQLWLFEIPFFQNISLIIYPMLTPSPLIIIGFLVGFGAMAGDLLKSFFKRQLGIPSGKPWIPFDQLDFVIGALIAVSIFYVPPTLHIFIIIILTPFLHLFINLIAYGLKLKKVWW